MASHPPGRVNRSDLQKMVCDKRARPSRRQIIADGGTTGRIDIAGNPSADGTKPWYEAPGFEKVTANERYIAASAKKYGVDPDLVRAVAWMETTHGYYEAPFRWVDQNTSILPMNINTNFWKDTWGSREALKDSEKNIDAGAKMLKSISTAMPDASIATKASVYNNSEAKKVSDYGARVQKIYEDKPWLPRDEKPILPSILPLLPS